MRLRGFHSDPMIVLLGASGYVGEAFARALHRRGKTFLALARKDLDYTRFSVLLGFLREQKPEFLINAAGFTGRPNVDVCESARAETLMANTVLPVTLADACAVAGVPWGHISSGCIYSGAKVLHGTELRIERDLRSPGVDAVVRRHPERIVGFTESDPPNFCFRNGPCSFYSGAKALSEEVIANGHQSYVWRLRIPFDERNHPRNYLTKLQHYTRVYDNVNSLSHRGDFAAACLGLWERRAPYGVYNLTNPGFVTTRQVVRLIERILKPDKAFRFWKSDAEFYEHGALTPRSNCILDVSKARAAGLHLRPVEEALESSLRQWQ